MFLRRLLLLMSSFLLLVFLTTSEGFISSSFAQSPTGDGLFVAVDQSGDLSEEPGVARGRFVNVNFDLLGGKDGPPLDGSGLGEIITLNLFDGAVFTAIMDRVERNPSGSYTWIGHLAETPHGQVILVVNNGLMVADISTPKGTYGIHHIDGALHAVAEQDSSAILSGGNDFISVELPAEQQNRVLQASDDGSVIDLMVVYTDDAVTANTAATVLSWIDLFVAYTNQSYANSDINHRVSLVHTQEVTYSETGALGSDLTALQATADGNVDTVHTLRNTYHADLVMMLVNNGDGNTASCGGLAYLQENVSQAFESNGFAVMEACSFGSVVFAHEIGHNMGSRHDWFEDGGPSAITPYPYAHGYVDTTNKFRTIMAYNDHCAYLSVGTCTRVPYWSNPSVNYNGAPTGVSSSGPTNCLDGQSPPTDASAPNPSTCAADAHLTLNNTASNTASFRSSEIVWTGATDTDWNTPSNWNIELGVPGSTITNNRVPLTIDNVKIPSSPTGGRFPTISSGTMEAREVLIETGASLTVSGGTLNVYGSWEEQGTGSSTMSGGTVVFKSNLDQTITASANSTFYNVQIGDSTSQNVTLSSDLDVNGNLTLSAGATLSAGSNTINVAGNWDDQADGFAYGTSTVVFDGSSSQTVDKVSSTELLNEDFSSYDSLTGSTISNSPPSGWATENNGTADNWYFTARDLDPNGGMSGNGHVRRGDQFGETPNPGVADAWLYTLGVNLDTDSTYKL